MSIRSGQKAADNLNKKAEDTLTNNYRQAQKYLAAGQTSATGALNQQAAAAKAAINQGVNTGQGQLTQGANTAAGYYNQALPTWQDLVNAGQAGIANYGELLTNPDSVFNSALYQSRENAGIDALNRLANSRGMLKSGNNTQDILDYMRRGGLDYFTTLLNAYNPYFGMAQNAAQGQTGIYGMLGNLYNTLGQNQAGLTQWGAGQNSNTANQLGANLSNVYTGTAAQQSGASQNLGNQKADLYTGWGQQQNNAAINQANKDAQDQANWFNLAGAALGAGSKVAGAYYGA